MNNYKLTFSAESTNRYEKAKQDILQALRSCGELSPQEKGYLMQEIFGAANVAVLREFSKRYLGEG